MVIFRMIDYPIFNHLALLTSGGGDQLSVFSTTYQRLRSIFSTASHGFSMASRGFSTAPHGFSMALRSLSAAPHDFSTASRSFSTASRNLSAASPHLSATPHHLSTARFYPQDVFDLNESSLISWPLNRHQYDPQFNYSDPFQLKIKTNSQQNRLSKPILKRFDGINHLICFYPQSLLHPVIKLSTCEQNNYLFHFFIHNLIRQITHKFNSCGQFF